MITKKSMMNDINTPVVLALIGAISGAISALVVGVVSTLSMRKKYSADAASTISSAALSLYNRSETRVDDLEAEISELREMYRQAEDMCIVARASLADLTARFDIMAEENAVMKETIIELRDGIVLLSHQLEEANITPGYVPDDKPIFFRGDDEPSAQRDD